MRSLFIVFYHVTEVFLDSDLLYWCCSFCVAPQLIFLLLLLLLFLFSLLPQSIATADMDHAQLEAFLTAQTRKQGSGGVNAEQAAALSRFWKSQRVRVRESLLSQSRWEPGLRGLSWRVDLQTAAGRGDAAHSGPVALMELELGRAGQVRPTSCVSSDTHSLQTVESNIKHMLNTHYRIKD
uniref:COMM domain-containing protein 1 n=1 Tax=Seriola lalandi dorsalis TaxID=1841481 RepID=A0A3B4Y648_SERLL